MPSRLAGANVARALEYKRSMKTKAYNTYFKFLLSLGCLELYDRKNMIKADSYLRITYIACAKRVKRTPNN